MRRAWPQSEIDYLQEYYNVIDIQLMMRALNRTKSQIQVKASRLKLTKPAEDDLEGDLIATGGKLIVIGNRTIHNMFRGKENEQRS